MARAMNSDETDVFAWSIHLASGIIIKARRY